MKTKSSPSLNCAALVLLALLPLASTASETAGLGPDQASEPPTHVLFTGADIRILYQGAVYPVQECEDDSFVIHVKDKARGLGVPLSGNARKFVVARVQTLADRSASVTNYRYERAYTAANDPYRKASEGIQNAIALADVASRLDAQVRAEPEKITVYRGGMKVEVVDNPLRADLQQQLDTIQNNIRGDMGNSGYYAGKMAEEQALELFDALEMQFEVASDPPIQNAYMVVLAQYHTKDRPKDSETWILAKSLGAINSSPRDVWLREGGLPPGYVLESVRVHLYEHGVEIATNLSENRAALTRDEAHEYLVIEHMSMHKADTKAARIVLTRLPESWATHPKDESFHQAYHVKVDKDGRPAGVFEDAACEIKVANSYYDAVLRDQLFLPALEKGNPVDSVVRVKPTNLSPGEPVGQDH